MRKITLSIFALLFTTSIFAQFGVSIPTSSVQWTTERTASGVVSEQGACTTNSTIVVGANTYHQLQRCGQINTLGAFREAGNRVYWLAPDSTNEHILYDFNLTVGQTISNVIYIDGFSFYEFPFIYLSGTLTVSAVSTVVVNGTNRKKIEFAGSTAAWIEGVGNTNGFLLNNEAITTGFELELKCMIVGGNAVYPIAGMGPCQFNVGIEDKYINNKVTISPNPSTGNFYVNMEGVTGSMDVQITDLNGKTVANIENHDSQKSISTNLKSGAYIIRATVNGKVTTSKLIIE